MSVWARSPLLYAHRGAAAEEPENTLASFQRGLSYGADVLEMDLHMTSDGHIVVSHDPSGARLAGVPAEIRRTRLCDVKTWDVGRGFSRLGESFAGRGYRIPTLEEVLVELPGVPLNVDAKQTDPPLVEPLLALLRRMRAEERVLVASFSGASMRRVRRLRYPGRAALSRDDVLALLALPRVVLRRLVRPGDAAQLPARVGRMRLARRGLIDKCHALGLRVDFWTVNDPREARALLALGADGIMTDDPAAIAPVFGR